MATRTQHWMDFKRWCTQRKLKARPAHPWTIAAYLRLIDRRLGAKDAQEALDAISREHVLKTMRAPMRHAIVARTMEMIERRGEVRDQHAALFDEQDVLGESSPPQSSPQSAPRSSPQSPLGPHPKSTAKPARRVFSNEPRLKSRRPPLAKG
jgi:hypothetical protein